MNARNSMKRSGMNLCCSLQNATVSPASPWERPAESSLSPFRLAATGPESAPGGRCPRVPPLPPYESTAGSQTTRRLSGKSGAAASKATDEKGGQNLSISAGTVSEASPNSSRTEERTTDKNRKSRKSPPKEIPEYLYCTIDGWQRTFRFGVNRLPPDQGTP